MTISKEQEKLLKIETDRFLEILHEQYGLYIDSTNGFKLYQQQLKSNAQMGIPSVTFALGNPIDPDAIILHHATMSEIIIRNQEDGLNGAKVRAYILIMIYEHWENDIRAKIAVILGLSDKANLKSNIMGDINKIRQDLLHNRGTALNSVKNKIIKFIKDKPVIICSNTFDKIFKEIFEYLNQLFLEKTGSIAYKDHSLNQKYKEWHRSMKHTIQK